MKICLVTRFKLDYLYYLGDQIDFLILFSAIYLLQIEPTSEGKLDFDRERVAALLVLAISAPLSQKQNAFGIPPRIFSYAVTLLGRISVALTDVVDQDALLAYLFQSSRSTGFSASDFNFEANNAVETLFQKQKGASNILQSWATTEALDVASPLVRSQLSVHNELMKSMNLILEKVKDIWLLMQSGFAKEVLGSLRLSYCFVFH